MPLKRIFFLILLCVLLPVPSGSAGLPARHVIEGLTPIYQGKNECVPTAVMMVVRYWGVLIDREELKKALFWHPQKGVPSVANTIFYLTDILGFTVETESGGHVDITRVINEIARDRPVIVRQWLSRESKERAKGSWSLAHWRVVYGYDRVQGKMYIQDPLESAGAFEMSFRDFVELWDMRQLRRTIEMQDYPTNWMMVIYK